VTQERDPRQEPSAVEGDGVAEQPAVERSSEKIRPNIFLHASLSGTQQFNLYQPLLAGSAPASAYAATRHLRDIEDVRLSVSPPQLRFWFLLIEVRTTLDTTIEIGTLRGRAGGVERQLIRKRAKDPLLGSHNVTPIQRRRERSGMPTVFARPRLVNCVDDQNTMRINPNAGYDNSPGIGGVQRPRAPEPRRAPRAAAQDAMRGHQSALKARSSEEHRTGESRCVP
jgi:hypothetical protein